MVALCKAMILMSCRNRSKPYGNVNYFCGAVTNLLWLQYTWNKQVKEQCEISERGFSVSYKYFERKYNWEV